MKVTVDQLARHLEHQLAPLYMVSGDEPLQLMETCDAIRGAARRHGCSERLIFHVESGFDWHILLQTRDSLSLFAERRLLELRLSSLKPGEVGAQALIDYTDCVPGGDILLIICPKLDQDVQRSKWYAALAQFGVIVQVWPVEAGQLPTWIERRMRAKGLEPGAEAIALLSQRVEGNLFAAVQEIEKLALIHGSGPLDATSVATVMNSARYNLYDLADRALAGDTASAARTLAGLQSEGEEPVLVLWALTREIRLFSALAASLEKGLSLDKACSEHRIWDKRKPLARAALRRHTVSDWQVLLLQAARIDRIIKGQAAGRAWDELMQLTLAMAGIKPLWKEL